MGSLGVSFDGGGDNCGGDGVMTMVVLPVMVWGRW